VSHITGATLSMLGIVGAVSLKTALFAQGGTYLERDSTGVPASCNVVITGALVDTDPYEVDTLAGRTYI
jgi:hypothetical protein